MESLWELCSGQLDPPPKGKDHATQTGACVGLEVGGGSVEENHVSTRFRSPDLQIKRFLTCQNISRHGCYEKDLVWI